jgi:hypothetical protein
MMMSYIFDSLTTTHEEAGLPTPTAQRGGLREVVARGRSLGLSLATFPTKHARSRKRLHTRLGMVCLGRDDP